MSLVRGGSRVNRTYTVIVENAGSNFSGYVPDLPGCIATGAMIGETISSLEEAAAFHVEGFQEAGEEIPENNSFAG